MGMRKVLAAVAIGAVLQALVWGRAQHRANPPDVDDLIESISFDPVAPGDNPLKGDPIRVSQIDSDLDLVASYAKSIRTYRSTGGAEMIPAMAASRGLNVMVGAWINPPVVGEDEAARKKREADNKREVDTAIELARNNRNVRAVFVGNEVLLRAENKAMADIDPSKPVSAAAQQDSNKALKELISFIRYTKKRVKVPVTTGEIWNNWLATPRLVTEVDFIAAHILPYWEGVPTDQTLHFAWMRYDDLRRRYPGKRVVIAEFGHPSRGYNVREAWPGPVEQARIMRQFMADARVRGAEYNLFEAFDQPWKTTEGGVGANWGLFDAGRNLKFPLFGPVEETDKKPLGMVGGAVGALIAVFGLWRRQARFGHALAYVAAANVVGAGVAAAAAYPFLNYMSFGAWVMWTSGFGLMLVLAVITMAKVNEIAAVLLGHAPKRLIGRLAPPAASAGYAPKVSIHIPAYREPAEMLKQTLDSVARLDYPNFEAVVVINNTPEEHYWQPIEAHCRALGERFKFVYVPRLAGFKAGALNVALEHTAADAEVIGVIDADYTVEPDWLKDLVPYFADHKVALVQAPQDHRDGTESPLKTMMNAEYAGFFDIGMVQRNEDNAIVQHGTMCLVRRHALAAVGGWKSDTIVEDTELGLRLLEAGWLAHYTNRRYGRGLLPDTYKAFQTQRHRWAYGAVQIIKKHWRHMLPQSRTLTPAQKRGFVAGWFFWLSDALGALAALAALFWVPMVLLVGVLIPTVPLSVPILVAFLVNIVHCVLLYRERVRESGPKILGAATAAMSLQWTVAKAVFQGFIKDGLPFNRTDKGGNAKRKAKDDTARWELRIGIALLLGAIGLMQWNYHAIVEQSVFALTLAVQSVPFLAAALMRGVERGLHWGSKPASQPLADVVAAPAGAPVPVTQRATA